MKLINNLFEIVENSESESGFTTTIKLNPGHIAYEGHFPGHPVTPGVIQLQIVHELSENHFQKKLKLITMAQCKFLKILNPNETPQIDIVAGFTCTENILNVKAHGKNEAVIFFKLNAVYQFI